MKTSFRRVVIALTVLLAVIGSFSPNSNAKKERRSARQSTDCSKIDNAALTARVNEKISATALLSGQNIRVEANAGVVTLRGNVSSSAKKRLAGRVVASVRCVKRVVNDLAVTPPLNRLTEYDCCCDGACWVQSRPCPFCSPGEDCLTQYKAASEKAAGDREALEKAWEAFQRCLCKKDN